MKRTVALLLLLCLLPLSLLSCGEVSAEEILPVAKDLIERSLILNEIYLGEGIPTGEIAFSNYRYADTAFCREHGILSIAALREKTEGVYTPEVADILYRKALTTNAEELGEYRDRTPVGEGLYVLIARESWYTETEYEYLYDTLTLEDSSRGRATVSLTVRITPKGESTQERRLSLPLVEGKDGWRCDKLTYVAYDNSQNQ